MKHLVMASVLATSSIFAVTACTSVGATTDTSASTSLQQHYKGMSKDGVRGPLAQLNLSAAQQSQIQALKQNGHNERVQTRAAIQQILTVEQRAQLDSIKSERGNKGRQGQHKAGQHKRGHYNTGQKNPLAQLNLSATQQTQIEAIKKNTSSDWKQKREAMMAILSKEQRAQLEAAKSPRHGKGHQGNHSLNQ